MSYERVLGSEWPKGGYSKSKGQPPRRQVSAWLRCKQNEHGEDLVQVNRGSERRALSIGVVTELNKTQQAAPYQGTGILIIIIACQNPG